MLFHPARPVKLNEPRGYQGHILMIYDDFLDRLEYEAYEAESQAIDDIQMALDNANVEINNRKIIWADGERLSIDQSLLKISSISKADIKILKYHIVLWLEMDFVPEDLNEKEMEIFEKQIAQWINDYEAGIE
jgi:hypothetical protein